MSPSAKFSFDHPLCVRGDPYIVSLESDSYLPLSRNVTPVCLPSGFDAGAGAGLGWRIAPGIFSGLWNAWTWSWSDTSLLLRSWVQRRSMALVMLLPDWYFSMAMAIRKLRRLQIGCNPQRAR